MWVLPRRAAAFPALPWRTTFAHSEEVDALLEVAVAAGATLIKPARDTFWGGYSGYFADPEGHLWEIAWNPHFGIE